MQSGRAGGGKPNAAGRAQLPEKRREPGALSGGDLREAVADEGDDLADGLPVPAVEDFFLSGAVGWFRANLKTPRAGCVERW